MEQRFIKRRGAWPGWEGNKSNMVVLYISWPRAKCIKNEKGKKNWTTSMLNTYHTLSRQQKRVRGEGLIIGWAIDLKKDSLGERPLAHCNLCEEMLYTADSHFLRMAGSTAQLVPVSELDWDIRVQGRQSSLTPITLMSNGPSDWLRLLES